MTTLHLVPLVPSLLGSGLLLIGNLEQTLAGETYTESWLNELTSAYEPLGRLFNRRRPGEGDDAEMAAGCGAFAGVSDSFGGCGSGGCSGSGGSGGSGCGGGGCGGG
ncbi:hypothetical protein [Haliscomenobacter sp.]|uniref:hypothetical protein n=1 Tax=Haliscomenobacter sp. TaxID=2717303 RepID=UPI003592E9A3